MRPRTIALFGFLALSPCYIPMDVHANCQAWPAIQFLAKQQQTMLTEHGNDMKAAIEQYIMTQTKELSAKLDALTKAQTAAQSSMEDKLYKNLEALLIRIEDAKAAESSQRRLSAQSFNHCSGRDVASAGASGATAAKVSREQANVVLAQSGEGTKNTEAEAKNGVRKRVQEGPLKDEMPLGQDLFPANDLIDSQKTRKAEDVINLILDPYPNPKVSDESTLAGAQSKVEQRVKQSRLAIPTDTLHAVKADNDAVMPAELLEEYVKTSNANNVVVPKDANGMTSIAAFYDILGSKTRILNPNWHKYLMEDVTDEIGVLRELAMMKALELGIQVDTRNWLKRIAALLAQNAAIMVENSNERISGVMFAPGVAPVSGGQQ